MRSIRRLLPIANIHRSTRSGRSSTAGLQAWLGMIPSRRTLPLAVRNRVDWSPLIGEQ
jgi:hypothetical protein